MPISLQADSVLPRGYILIDNQRVVTASITEGLSANNLIANTSQIATSKIANLSASILDTDRLIGVAGEFLVPVGSVMAFATNTNPAGWLKLNGAELSRNQYSRLWAFAQTSGNLVPEATWTATNQGSFSTGNLTTTFRIPDLRGEFIRSWADDKSVDSGRLFGTFQTDTFKTHNHTIRAGAIPAGGGVARIADAVHAGNNGYATNAGSDGGGTETRPRNVALLYCIKY